MQREPRRQKEYRWRATLSILALGHRLGLSFIWEAAYREKWHVIFFPRFIEAVAEAKVLSYSGRGQILLL